MKLLNFVALLFIALSIKAQSLKPNANQKEAIEYIQAVLSQASAVPSNDGNGVIIQTFDGTTMKIDRKWRVAIRDIYSKIDWSKYSHLKIAERGKDSSYFCNLIFTAKHIERERILITSFDGELNKLDSYHIDTTFAIIEFQLPSSFGTKIRELEVAFNRLKALVTGGIKLPINYTSRIKEVQGKPSFYETVKYVNNFLETQKGKEFKCFTTYSISKLYLTIDEENNIFLVSKYYDYFGGTTRTYNYKIPLQRVESIQIEGKGSELKECWMAFLEFKKSGEDALSEHHLPLWVTGLNYSLKEIKNERIYKAFDHLRKMLGAKDPLEF